jgi:hypothetical protein
MRCLVVLVVFLTVIPATGAFGSELDELLERSHDATYAAEQIISCSTPDGVRDAVVRVTQRETELRVSSSVTDDVEVAAGAGTWSMRSGGSLVVEAAVEGGKDKTEPLYSVEEERSVGYLGRAAMSYLLIRDGEPRAELVFDDETGALVEVVTFTLDGEVYCERRFVSLETDIGPSGTVPPRDGSYAPVAVETSNLPEEVSGFERLEQY